MKLVFWRGQVRNFGDEINPWLWGRLLPGFFDDDESELFLGIGSVLWNDFPLHSRKIVFGSGYGAYTPRPVIDDSWSIYFLRGPRSAALIGADPSYALGDPATLVRVAIDHLPLPAHLPDVGFMPHWESARDGNWEPVARAAGMTFVDPRWEVERVIQTIRSCKLLVTEAMHGAIVADTLRTPWVPFAPQVVHHLKWYDWADTLDLTFEFAPSARSSFLELLTAALPYDTTALRRVRKYAGFLNTVGSSLLRSHAVEKLKTAASMRPYLSRDENLERLTERLLEQLRRLRFDFPNRRSSLQHAETA